VSRGQHDRSLWPYSSLSRPANSKIRLKKMAEALGTVNTRVRDYFEGDGGQKT
jgi:hypothetical protein